MPDQLSAFLTRHALPNEYGQMAGQHFLPLAAHLAKRVTEHEPLFVGINGCQGSGKSTLAAFLADVVSLVHKRRVAVLSIDDFYFDSETRTQLARNVHPLLRTRGVPGTHDTALFAHTLQALRQTRRVALPRFNKATDNPFPKTSWPVCDAPVDVVIVEGWCWGTPAQSQAQLRDVVNTLEQERDPARRWRTYINEQIRQNYEPLYAEMDVWLMLKAPSFCVVADWRKQQEHKLRASQRSTAKRCMTDAEVDEFIQYFQRLTEHSLKTLPAKCAFVFELNENRKIIRTLRR
mgnify:CR=1 FL=1